MLLNISIFSIWNNIFADDIEIGEGAKNEIICQCGQKELFQSSNASKKVRGGSVSELARTTF